MSGGGGGDAEEAARINTELSSRYAAVGLPAVKGSLGYATSMLDHPIPQYAETAYRGAATSALEAGAAKQASARDQLIRNLKVSGGGGPALADLTRVNTGGAIDLADEISSIGATRAMAGISQRNNLLSILSGGAAGATDLAANFGRLNTAALGTLGERPGAYPYIVGGTAALSPALLKFLDKPNLGGGGGSSTDYLSQSGAP